MTKNKLTGLSLLHTLGVFAYIGAIAWFLSNTKNWFGQAEDAKDAFVPIAIRKL